MPITIVNGTPSVVSDAFESVKTKIRSSKRIPEPKRRLLIALWEGNIRWTLGGIDPLTDALENGTLGGYTDRSTKDIRLNQRIIDAAGVGNQQSREQLEAVIFHELVHATGEEELDTEVLENLVFAGHGATPPTVDDTGTVVGGKLSSPGHGFSPPPPPPPDESHGPVPAPPPVDPWGRVIGDHYIWDPRTGRVWRKGANGQPVGAPIFEGGAWRRPEALRQPNGHYFIGELDFDPMRLRLTTIGSKTNERQDVPAGPQFIVGLFLAVQQYERELMEERRPQKKGQRPLLPIILSANVIPSVPTKRSTRKKPTSTKDK